MANRQQKSPLRLSPKIHAMVDEQLRALRAKGYSGSLSTFVNAGVLELLKLDIDSQLQKVYAVPQTTDALVFERKISAGLERTEPPLPSRKPGSRRKAGGDQ